MNRQTQYESVKLVKEKLTGFFIKKLIKNVFLSGNLSVYRQTLKQGEHAG